MYNELTKTKNLPCWQELSTRKKQLLKCFKELGRPYSVKTIDGEPVVYRLEETFDVEISQSKQSPFRVFIWGRHPMEIVRCRDVQSRDIPAAAAEIDRFVEDYMVEVADAV